MWPRLHLRRPARADLYPCVPLLSAEDMYNYSSYPSLLLFRGDPSPEAKCPWDEDCPPNKDGCPHPGTQTLSDSLVVAAF